MPEKSFREVSAQEAELLHQLGVKVMTTCIGSHNYKQGAERVYKQGVAYPGLKHWKNYPVFYVVVVE